MIPYGRHVIAQEDIDAVTSVLRSDWLTTGPAVETFEKDLTEWTGGVPAVAVSSGTAALHVAYAAIGVGPGDEIITTPLTFVATQATAAVLGARIVFADVSPDTGNIDPEHVARLVTPRTKAIAAVDYAGHPADMDALRDIADGCGALLVEDAAHSLGSTYAGRPVGSLADVTTFSFFPTKNITTGEGGAVVSANPELLTRARRFARQGLVREAAELRHIDEGPWHQEVHSFGLNYRLPDILATLGSRQLHALPAFKRRRAEIKAVYDAGLEKLAGVDVPACRAEVDPMWHLYPLRVPAARRRAIYEHLRSAGVGVQVNYIPAYWHPVFADLGYERGLCPTAEDYYRREISLPMYPSLTDEQVRTVIGSVAAALEPA
jgi:dTDP-4-amino-4,6-dideoxygalactose transaminase